MEPAWAGGESFDARGASWEAALGRMLGLASGMARLQGISRDVKRVRESTSWGGLESGYHRMPGVYELGGERGARARQRAPGPAVGGWEAWGRVACAVWVEDAEGCRAARGRQRAGVSPGAVPLQWWWL